jgi:SPP1 family predicted phage head-tail adaptor
MEREGKKSLSTELRHYVTILTETSTADGEGGFTVAWAESDPVAAQVSPIQARQVFQYRSINVEATHLIKVRGETVVGETNKIKFGAREFEVLTCEDIQERGIVKVITCKEVRA